MSRREQLSVDYVKGFYAGIRAARAVLRESRQPDRSSQFDGPDIVGPSVNHALASASEKISNLEPEEPNT